MRDKKWHVSTNKWVKIWFSTDPNQFLSDDNKERLDQFLKNNPQADLKIITDTSLLNDTGLCELANLKVNLLMKFGNRISLIDLTSFSPDDFIPDLERKLFDIAKTELKNLEKGGNAAAASDIIRLLSLSYQDHIYTDFDIDVDCSSKESSNSFFKAKPIPDHVELSSAFVINYFEIESRSITQPPKKYFNNDVLIVLDNADTTLLEIQNRILNNYQKQKDTIMAICDRIAIEFKKFISVDEINILRQFSDIFLFRLHLKEKIEKTIDDLHAEFFKALYIYSVTFFTGPGVYAETLKKKPEVYRHSWRYNNDVFKKIFRIEGNKKYLQDGSWIPKSVPKEMAQQPSKRQL